MNTIGDMLKEKYFYSHYNEFEYNHDYKIMITMTWNDKIKMGFLIYTHLYVTEFMFAN